MYIFYDFETSSRQLLGQILTYCFVVVDSQFQVVETCSGKIRLNRIQLPEIDAILTNKIDLETHQQEGNTEFQAAVRIYRFLLSQVQQHGYCTLVGYNSNQFDLNFLRNLLIRYGINPYFDGKMGNLDVLHFVQWVAYTHVDQFPWTLVEKADRNFYYTFTLETVATSHELLAGAQIHSAEEDVTLLIRLVQAIQTRYGESLLDFRPVWLIPEFLEATPGLAKQKVADYPKNGETPKKFTYRYWLRLVYGGKDVLALDLEAYFLQPSEPLAAIRYINPNKASFILEPMSTEEVMRFSSLVQQASADLFLNSLKRDQYFEMIKKDWDIEHQIHELGFQRIETLGEWVADLMADPERYHGLLRQLLAAKSEKKDTYLIQLFNRAYLNYHPSPKAEHLHRYLVPRYIEGALLKDITELQPIGQSLQRLAQLKEDPDEQTRALAMSIDRYYQDFLDRNFLRELIG